MENKFFKIFKYGEEVLKLKAEEIKNIDEKIKKLTKKMSETLHNVPGGIGLAAPQIGESIQLAVIDLSMGENENEQMVLINPEIVESDGNETEEEGCLSLPGFLLPIARKPKILLRSVNLDGKEIEQEFEGFKARVIQHEIDHLEGVLIVDRVSSLKRQLVKREIKKLKKNGEW